MSAKEIKQATTNLTCPICYQLFKNPKYLPCYHSYCEECLEKMVVQSKITCPECRQEAVAPAGGVKEFANNFFISRMVDELVLQHKVEGEEEVKCDECDEDEPVVSYCPECNVFLCNFCNDNHKRNKRFRGHGIVPFTELKSNKDVHLQAKAVAPMCKEHDEQLKYYCETCEQLVCVYCTVKDHNGHNHDTVKKMTGKHRQEIEEITAPVEEMITSLSEARDNIDKMRVKIRQQGDEVNKKIDQHYDELVQKLMEQKKLLKQQADDTVSQKEKVVTTQLEEVDYVQAEILSMKELKDALEKSSDQEALSAKKLVIDRMQQLTDKYKKLNSQSVRESKIELKFVPSKELFPQFGQLFNDTKFPAVSTNEQQITEVSCSNGLQYLSMEKPCKIVSCNGQMGCPWGIAFCENGMWAAADYSKHRVYIFDDQDQLVRVVGGEGNKSGELYHPIGVAFEGDNHLYVADLDNNRVQKFVVDGNYILQFGGKGNRDNQLSSPYGITAHNGKVYVTDTDNKRVSVFQSSGQFCHIIGDGHLNIPFDVVVNNDHQLLVADHGNHCIYTFSIDGHFMNKFGTHGTGKKLFCKPRNLTVDLNEFILVSDFGNYRISVFDKFENCIHQFGSRGSDEGQFRNHGGIAVSPKGLIYISDGGNKRIQIFSTKTVT